MTFVVKTNSLACELIHLNFVEDIPKIRIEFDKSYQKLFGRCRKEM